MYSCNVFKFKQLMSTYSSMKIKYDCPKLGDVFSLKSFHITFHIYFNNFCHRNIKISASVKVESSLWVVDLGIPLFGFKSLPVLVSHWCHPISSQRLRCTQRILMQIPLKCFAIVITSSFPRTPYSYICHSVGKQK